MVMVISIAMYLASNQGAIFTEEFDNKILAGYWLESNEATQVKYRWDEVSRVSLYTMEIRRILIKFIMMMECQQYISANMSQRK